MRHQPLVQERRRTALHVPAAHGPSPARSEGSEPFDVDENLRRRCRHLRGIPQHGPRHEAADIFSRPLPRAVLSHAENDPGVPRYTRRVDRIGPEPGGDLPEVRDQRHVGQGVPIKKYRYWE